MKARTAINDTTGANEAFIPGILVELPQEYRTNTKGTLWGLGFVEVTRKDGSTTKVRAMIYKRQVEAVDPTTGELLFTVGASVELATQIDGEYAGNARIQLPNNGGVSASLAAEFGINLNKEVGANIEAEA